MIISTASPASTLVSAQPGSDLDAAVVAADRVAATLASAPAHHAGIGDVAETAEDRGLHRPQETDAPQRAVARALLALAAGAAANVEILEHHRKAGFQHFGIGEARIGHVNVNGARAVKAGARRRAGADGLVILIGVVAEGEVVHRSLR